MISVAGRFPRHVLLAGFALALALFAFEYRFASMGGPLGGFENDQFVHLSEAQQVVLGELPSRDFVDIGGMPLTIGLSALAQRVGGRTLLAEAVLTTTIIAVCAATLFVLSYAASGSIWVALAIALIQIAMAPRFYNYPKLLAYAIGIPALWAYIDRPAIGRLALLAAAVVCAFLLRYDHGAYLGITAAVAVAAVHRHAALSMMGRSVGSLVALGLLFAVPYLLFLQFNAGIMREVGTFVTFSQWAASRTTLKADERSFVVDRKRRLFELAPERPSAVAIHVRWKPDVTNEMRSLHERTLGLTPIEQISTQVWAYEVKDDTTARLKAVVDDGLVADTEGIDRTSYLAIDRAATDPPTGIERVLTTLGRIRIVPGLIRADNAIPFMFWLLALLPALTLVALVAARRMPPPLRRRDWNQGTFKIAIVGVLGVVMMPGLLRGNLGSRLADVTEVAGVCAAWLAGTMLATSSPRWRRVATAVIVIVAVLAVASVNAIENVTGQVAQSRVLEGFQSAIAEQRDVGRALRAAPPFASSDPPEPGDPRVARYLNECTSPDDRILSLSYSPQIFFMSARGFAGGLAWVRPELFDSEREQRLMIERLRAQQVPIVITDPEPAYSEDYVPSFGLVDEYVRDTFRYVGEYNFGRGRVYRILAQKDLAPVRDYPPFGLPCFR